MKCMNGKHAMNIENDTWFDGYLTTTNSKFPVGINVTDREIVIILSGREKRQKN